MKQVTTEVIKLPAPLHKSGVAMEEALLRRRSQKNFVNGALTLQEIAQLLWAAQGITNEEGGRTVPSAGAFYPLEIYILVANAEKISAGIYHYEVKDHVLTRVAGGDKRMGLAAASFMQNALIKAAAILVIASDQERTTRKYGEKGKTFVHMEAGHVSQNVYLQAVVLNLGTMTIGSFNEAVVRSLLQLPPQLEVLYLMPVGLLVARGNAGEGGG